MNPISHVWQVALALVAIVALVLLLGWLARRLQGVRHTAGKRLKIVDSIYLGPKERIVLLQVDDQQVLVGMNPNCVARLCQLQGSATFSQTLAQVHPEDAEAGELQGAN